MSSAAPALIDGYDAALFDLDGVVYLGPAPVPGAAQGLAQLRQDGCAVGFVTNNAARTPEHVVDHLRELGIQAEVADVVTSAQACARLAADQLPAAATVLVTGTAALAAEVAAVGLTVVDEIDPVPAAVIQGYDPTMAQPRLDQAGFAIQRGARWYATNTDANRPTDQGLVPGAGAQVATVAAAVTVAPIVAGKPCAPLMHETVRRLGAAHPIFVGDRLDTDIEGAVGVGMDSLMVLTGAHGKHDLAAAEPGMRPTHLGWDLRALLQPALVAHWTNGDQVQVGEQIARLISGQVVLDQVPADRDQQVAALWAILQLIWTGRDGAHALTQLTLIP